MQLSDVLRVGQEKQWQEQQAARSNPRQQALESDRAIAAAIVVDLRKQIQRGKFSVTQRITGSVETIVRAKAVPKQSTLMETRVGFTRRYGLYTQKEYVITLVESMLKKELPRHHIRVSIEVENGRRPRASSIFWRALNAVVCCLPQWFYGRWITSHPMWSITLTITEAPPVIVHSVRIVEPAEEAVAGGTGLVGSEKTAADK